MNPKPTDISKLINESREDPTIFSKIDVDELLDSLESDKNDFLENQTIDSISEHVFNSLKRLRIDPSILSDYCKKLVGYRHVDELHLLHKGKYVRWLRLEDPTKLMNGGIVVDIKFGDSGANVMIRLTSGKFLQYRFDKCLTYQKLTEEEQLILTLYSQI